MSPTKSDVKPSTMSKTLGGVTRPRRIESDNEANKKADLAGPGIGNYVEFEKILPPGLHLSLDSKGNAKGDLPPSPLYRRQPMQRAWTPDGPGSVDG